ncbi:MAG: RHS repeat protein [Lentisphaerae bacterium]|nr:RHS repeat protein [Lentisphaerota bacterium]
MRFCTNRLMVLLALVAGFIGALPVSGQGSVLSLDEAGRLEQVLNSQVAPTSFAYDEAGNVEWRIKPDQEETIYQYDALNQLTNALHEGVWKSSFTYDSSGNNVAQASPRASCTFGFDEMNRLTTSTQSVDAVSFIVDNSYNLNGARTGIAYPGGLVVDYEYDEENRVKFITVSGGGLSVPLTVEHGYDGASRLRSITYPNGINSSFGYDAESRVTNIVHGSFINRAIQRNALGFKETELINAGLKPTVPATARSIKAHNDADQLVSESIQTDVANWTSVIYSYSANGCLTNQQSAAGNRHYQYDYDNRLVNVDDASSFVSYLYDATGARIGRIAEATSSSLSTNYFVVDYADGLKRPLAETDASGNVLRYYVWSGARLLCHIEANGTVRYYHADELGSTLALTDAAGNVTDQFAYMPYGYANHSGSTSTPFQWLGGYGVYYDSATDLHLTLHRAYSAKMKRFIHPDPLGIDGGANVYMWANMNPLAFVDPYGLSAFDWFSNGLSFVGGALQVAAGFTIAATTSWSGIGAYAGAALMVQGGSSMVASAVNMNNLRQGNDPGLNASGAIGLTTSLIFDDPKINAVASGLDVVVNVASGRVGLDAAKKVLLAKAAPGTVTRTVVDTTRFGTLSKTTNTSSEDLVKPIISVPTWQKGITRTGVGFTVAGAIMDNVKCY